MATKQNSLFFSFGLLNSDYNKLLLSKSFFKLQSEILINGLYSDIEFIRKETDDNSDNKFILNAYAQIERYKTELQNKLNILTPQIDLIHGKRNKALSSIYDDLNNFKFKYSEILNYKKGVVYIAREHDLNEYITIDKRQSLTKSNLSQFIKRLLLKGLCSKNEYRKAIKHGVYSENIKQRTNFFLSHKVNKHGHKKNYSYLTARRKRDKSIYEKHGDILIKFKPYAKYFYNSFIDGEILRKINAEKKIYSYCKINQ